jgi:RNA polymerase sigma-B factor
MTTITPRSGTSRLSAPVGIEAGETTDPDALTLEYLWLAESVAHRFFRRDPARDEDLVQVAYIGLVKSARRFDPEKGDSFPAFAVPTISGEIKRHLRDNGWFVRPPRHVQELRARVVEAVPRLSQELGRAPGMAELMVDLGEPAATIAEAIACQHHMYPASLDMTVGDEHAATLADLIPGTGDELEQAESAAVISSALQVLPPRERHVLHLRFFEDRTQQEIARELGVTQMQVSRILSKSLTLLRDRILYGTPAFDRAGRVSRLDSGARSA